MLRLACWALPDSALLAPLDTLPAAWLRIDPEHTPYSAGRCPDSTAHDATHWAGCTVAVFRATLSATDGPLSLDRGGQRERGKDKGRGKQ
ncbi:hypothetical protein MET9862_01223 [Methylobacterium symbioticum]|uniref:Uncharacterized protein n=1 Tax=Methylobacterium symbioticum TaxID=2584084 RepID=A0A509E8Y5_9HYPH|nr:hypothetical protein MET9862_01223 [Methylobacterium symbioticum]